MGRGVRVLHLHLHGLFRSRDLELGRDADTGGQTLYVLDLVRSLAQRPEVERVDVVTRLVQDRRVAADYGRPVELIASGARILRFPFGPKRYLRKEQLWPHLEDLADQLVHHLTQPGQEVDWIHAHYADAGFVGALVSQRLGLPLVFTGHSLGREKQRRLLAGGGDRQQIEQAYAMSRRIEAEEQALTQADLVITSTQQEADLQYARYAQFRRDHAQVIPPGVDAGRFHPVSAAAEGAALDQLLSPFLRDPRKPPLLAALGSSSVLRDRHNLVLVLGCREDPRQMEKQQRDVFQQVFDLVDRYDLYGLVAYPKQHRRSQVPAFYRWAAQRGGLFVNPALTEPFGLTLLEAAACGLPMVATDDGGPRDIQARCENGLLVDVTDAGALQEALERAGKDASRWRRWSDNGVEAVSRHFSWDAHVCRYLGLMQAHLHQLPSGGSRLQSSPAPVHRPDHLLLLDLDSTLDCPDGPSLTALRSQLERDGQRYGLGILTGRSLAAARQRYGDLHLPSPLVWISRAGSEIHLGEDLQPDHIWAQHIDTDWQRESVEAVMEDLHDLLELQSEEHQGPWKLSYLQRQPDESVLSHVRQRLRREGLSARPQRRCHWYLDVLPRLASRSEAIRHLALQWQLPLERVMVMASQQGDGELLRGLPATVVPADHDPCLVRHHQQKRVLFSGRPSLAAVLDGLSHYRFPSQR